VISITKLNILKNDVNSKKSLQFLYVENLKKWTWFWEHIIFVQKL